MGAVLTPWRSKGEPTEEKLESIFRDEGLRPSWWSTGPGDRYGAHSHPYDKVLYCARAASASTCPPQARASSYNHATASTSRPARRTLRSSGLKGRLASKRRETRRRERPVIHW